MSRAARARGRRSFASSFGPIHWHGNPRDRAQRRPPAPHPRRRPLRKIHRLPPGGARHVHKPQRIALAALVCLIAAPASAQLVQRKDLSYAIAKTIAENALEDCKARGYAVSVVVVDRGGNTVVALRGDNASVHTMENARRKAYTAMTFK